MKLWGMFLQENEETSNEDLEFMGSNMDGFHQQKRRWWLIHPSEKYAQVKLDPFPQRGMG